MCRHSLGGAVAVLAALNFHSDGIKNLELFTQGIVTTILGPIPMDKNKKFTKAKSFT